MSENKNARLPADNGKPVAWITRGKITMIRADAVMLDDTSLPLYIAPRKQWVGLTDEEVSDVIDNVLEGGGWLDVARALEAAIKRKNT